MQTKYTNTMECKFSVDTDVHTFACRIAYLTRNINLVEFPTEEGFITLQTADIRYSERIHCPPVVYISGRYYKLKEGAQIAEDPSPTVSMIRFQCSPLTSSRIEVLATCSEPAVEPCFKYILKETWKHYEEARPGIEQCWPEAYEQRAATIAELAHRITTTLDEIREQISTPATPETQGWNPPGHPGLDHDELIYRLAKAQQAEQIRHTDPANTWKEIAQQIQWNKGTSEPGLALLRDARHRLHRRKPGDPLLKEVAEYRAKETNET